MTTLNEVITEAFSSKPGVNVSYCANDVTVEHPNHPRARCMKKGKEPLWKLYFDGHYVMGLETVWDCFRVAQFLMETSYVRTDD